MKKVIKTRHIMSNITDKSLVTTPKRSSTSKRSKNSVALQPNPIDEKFSKVLSSFEKSLSGWKTCSLSGSKVITKCILPQKKETLNQGKSFILNAGLMRAQIKSLILGL